jgi:hypothetical protein
MTTADLAIHARTHDRRRVVEPLLVAVALALTYLIVAPASADLAAQVYRTDLFKEFGFTLWNGQWFAGHHTPGYSVLFPPLASVLGPRLVGALSAVAAAVLFERLTYPRWGSQARLGAIWFGAASATNLFTGRLTFALAWRSASVPCSPRSESDRRWPSSWPPSAPWPARSPGCSWRSLAAPGGSPPADGSRSSWLRRPSPSPPRWPRPSPRGAWSHSSCPRTGRPSPCAVAVLVLVPREEKAIRYGPFCTRWPARRAFLFDTPMGGNAARLGTLFGGPLLACLLWRRHAVALALLALPLLYWQWMPPVRDVRDASGDPSVQASYIPPPQHLPGRRASNGSGRDHADAQHWETVHVARRFSLARGWERQLDIKYNGSSTSPGWTRSTTAPGCRPTACSTWRSRSASRLRRSPGGETRAVRPALTSCPSGGTPTGASNRYKYTVPLVSGPAQLVSLRSNGITLHASESAWSTCASATPATEAGRGRGLRGAGAGRAHPPRSRAPRHRAHDRRIRAPGAW